MANQGVEKEKLEDVNSKDRTKEYPLEPRYAGEESPAMELHQEVVKESQVENSKVSSGVEATPRQITEIKIGNINRGEEEFMIENAKKNHSNGYLLKQVRKDRKEVDNSKLKAKKRDMFGIGRGKEKNQNPESIKIIILTHLQINKKGKHFFQTPFSRISPNLAIFCC
ncbi:hypothetical protein L6452_05090 [Arctium lappa]|uniref:Uncharacterized protein n=1 Tax=Arctium lappa TaxID=4217 RepID=A0ACB9EFV5_ARCLA|nr:hypothetical protein L6452_05090 [Arctium lappa]